MTILDMHNYLNLEIDKSDALDSVGFEPEELDYWLNSAIRSLVKTKYKGSSSARGEAFEQNQKRIDDLRTLIEEIEIIPSRGEETSDKPYSYKASLPSSPSYWFALSEEVLIAYQSSTTPTANGALVVDTVYKVSGGSIEHGSPAVEYTDGEYFIAETTNYIGDGSVYQCTTKRQGITEVTADTYRFYIDNPYSEHILENYKAEPLRLFKNNEVELITDGNYGIIKYYLRYLKEPAEVSYGDGTPDGDTDLPEHIHDEIVVLAANMILENTENPRYKTHMNEVFRTE